MVWITRSEVPKYLHKSAFYESLDELDQIRFEVPVDCFKRSDTICSEIDLRHMLRTLSFWGVHNVTTHVASYILHNKLKRSVLAELCDSFPEYHQILSDLVLVKTADPSLSVTKAIQSGFGISVVKLLCKQDGCVLTENACAAAASVNDLPLLRYLHEHNCPSNSRTTTNAIFTNKLRILQYACANECSLPEEAMELAAMFSCSEILIYLHSIGVAYPSVMYLNIFNLPAIQHLRSVGCDWHIQNCEAYAMEGQLGCLKYAHENECPWDEHVCAAAPRHGRLDCLKYCHEQGCPWDAFTAMGAAQYGQLECLKYAHTHGWPVDFKATNQALAYHQWRCLAYLLWHFFFFTAIPVMLLLSFALFTTACAYIVLTMKHKRTLNDYTQLISNTCWFVQCAMFIYGPRCCDNLPLRLKLHCALMVVQLAVGFVLVVSNPVIYKFLYAFVK